MNLHIDHREKGVTDTIKAEFDKPFVYGLSDVNIQVVTLDIGDYMITFENTKVLCIIERKTLVDYGSSLVDGRSTNIDKLLALKANTNCRIEYIVEGNINPGLAEKFGGVTYAAILANMTDISLVHDIHIIRTKNKIKTAEYLKLLCERMCSVYPKLTDQLIAGSNINEIIQRSKPSKAEVDKFQLLVIWENLLSKSNKIQNKPLSIAKSSILAARWTLAEWINGDIIEDEVAAIKVNGRRLDGKQIAKMSAKMTPEDQKKLLICIKGVTEDTANIILAKYTLDSFILDKEAKNLIINPNKGTKIGEAKVNKIIYFCHMKV